MPVGAGRPTSRPQLALPWQFAWRAAAIVAGLTLLLVVDVRGLVFYLAWVLIGLALASEATAMLVYWRHSRQG
jgi:hypothetical protein